MTRMSQMAACIVVLATIVGACGRGVRVLETSPKQTIGGGTVTGIVTGPDGRAPLVDRVVEAVNVTTAERSAVTTNAAGGYTLRLRPGTYRVELRLQPGESLAKHPARPLGIDVGEIETRVDFSVSGPARSR